MASSNAIGATSMGIMHLLTQAFDAALFDGRTAFFALDVRPPIGFGVSLSLWRVEAGGAARALPHPATGAPLTVDLHYLLAAWAEAPHDRQALLGWAMRVLHDTPVLTASLLNLQFPDTFGAGETVKLAAESLPGDQLAAAWALLGPAPLPSVGYVARGVTIDPIPSS